MGRGLSQAARNIVTAAQEYLNNSPVAVSMRHLFYRLSGMGLVPKDENGCKKIERDIGGARWRGEISFDDIIDDLREPIRVSTWDSPADFARTVSHAYKRDLWQSQDFHVEVWTEKDAMVALIRDICAEYRVTIRLFRGFTSDASIYETAKELKDISKPITILYLGDHDPSGLCIENEVMHRERDKKGERGRLYRMFDFLGRGQKTLELERLGATLEDLVNPEYADFVLASKETDKRSPEYIREYGDRTLGIDALPLAEITRRTESAIRRHILDIEAWESEKAQEAEERDRIVQVLAAISDQDSK